MFLLNLLFILFGQNSGAANGFFNASLNDSDNNPTSFQKFKSNKATAVVFLLVDCPASQDYTLTLNRLSSKYNSQPVSIVGIIPGKFSNDEEIKKFIMQYHIKFPVLK